MLHYMLRIHVWQPQAEQQTYHTVVSYNRLRISSCSAAERAVGMPKALKDSNGHGFALRFYLSGHGASLKYLYLRQTCTVCRGLYY